MKLAVIVPCLNEAMRLPALSAMLQRLDAGEIVCVDGGSEDGTVQGLRAAGLRCLESARGRARQMNAGAAACSADVLLFLHADTQIGAGHLRDVRRAMADPAVVGGRFDVCLSGEHPAFRLIERMINLRSRITRIATGDQAIFVRRRAFEQLGGFPEQPLMEDIAFSRQLKRHGRIACLRRPVITSSRRWEEQGIARTIGLMWWLRGMYWLGVPPEKLARRYRDVR